MPIQIKDIQRIFPGYTDSRKLEEHEFPESWNLAANIKDHLTAGYGKPRPYSIGYYHPHSIGGCSYIMACHRANIPPVDHKTPQSQLRLKVGHAVHEMTEKILDAMYPHSFRELELKMPALFIKGQCDDVIIPHDAPIVVEVKSVKTADLSRPKEEHMLQATLYCYCLEMSLYEILYVGLDGTLASFPRKYDHNLWEKILAKLTYVESCLQEGKMPDPAPNYWCLTCDYRHICPSPYLGGRSEYIVGE